MHADFKLVKQNISNIDYSYVGVRGRNMNPKVEFYIVDNWLSQDRPGDWVGSKKHGDFIIDDAKYTVCESLRAGGQDSAGFDVQFFNSTNTLVFVKSLVIVVPLILQLTSNNGKNLV